jgi:hypothetical protein
VSALDQFGESSNSTQAAALLLMNRPPVIAGITLLGTNLMVIGTNGILGGNYLVLASTNLALPLNQWPRIATNSFDGAGNFIFTNNLNPGSSRQFYLLQLP